MKKFLALVLAVLMVLSMAACNTTPVETTPPATQGGNDTPTQPKDTEPAAKDPVTITYWWGGTGEQEDTGKVEEKLNQILKSIPGYEYISIDLRPMKSFKKNFDLAMADKEQIDLVASYYLDVPTLWSQGAILPLDDLLEKYPNVTSQIPEFMIPMGVVHGEQAYIPSAQQATTMHFFNFDKDQFNAYLAANFMTRDEVRTILQSKTLKPVLDFLEDYTLFVRAYTGSDKIYCYNTDEMNVWWSLEFIDTDRGNILLNEDGGKVVWDKLTPEFQYLVSRYADWYERGLLHKDITVKFSGNVGTEDNLAYDTIVNVATEEMVEAAHAAGGKNYVSIQRRDHYYVPSKYAAGGTFIYADSKYPEECMMIMELLHTNLHGDEFYNTLVWGLEGEHWNWVDKENKRIETLEYAGTQGPSSASYCAWKWQVGNSFNVWKNQAVDDAQTDYIASVHADATTVASPAMGITWDMSEISDIVAQCKASQDEFNFKAIYSAGKNWKTVYDKLVTNLKVNGVDKVLAELNNQLEDHLEKQK